MARILFRSAGKDGGEKSAALVVQGGPAFTILNLLLREGAAIRHDCGGKAQCGTCRVRVLSDPGALSPPTERELERLAATGAAAGERLACQCRVLRDVELQASLPRKRGEE